MDSALQIIWFKRDVRVHDHEPLVRAAERGPVLGLYVYEPSLLGSAEYDAMHFHFVHDGLVELRERLRGLGSELLLRVGEVPQVLSELWAECRFDTFWAHEETGNWLTYQRDLAVQRWAQERGVPFVEIPHHGVVRRLKSRDGWAAMWERRMALDVLYAPERLRRPACMPASGELQDASTFGFTSERRALAMRGGESRAWKVLESFLTDRGQHYRGDMSSPVEGWRSCSRISPFLTWGHISMRAAYQRTLIQIEELRTQKELGEKVERGWFGSLDSFKARLHWHCHFMQKLEDEPQIEFRNVNRAFDGLRENDFNEAYFQAWCEGQTGYPMVDACMRALHQAGWINFRMRAMLVSFAAYHLWLHWRRPAVFLARHFQDFEPGIHFSQFQMQSGVTGINTVRIYSPIKQVLDQDPDGKFIRKYVPELANLPAVYLPEPHRMPELAQLEFGCRIGVDYPAPIVDHKAAYAQAKARIFAHRGLESVRDEAKRVYQKHGSRKSPERRR